MVVEKTLRFNRIFQPVFSTKARYIHIWGGRAAGRSHFATRYFLLLITQQQYFRGAFLRNVFGDIRDSLFQDFKDRIEESDYNEDDFVINETKMTILYKPTGNTIISKGFKKTSGNRSAKLKSLAGLTHVLCEEADENEEKEVNKLDDSIRTDKIENIQIIFLYNPPRRKHWLMKRYFTLVDSGITDIVTEKPIPYFWAVPIANPDVLAIHCTYKDNIQNLNHKTIARYEAYGNRNSQFYDPEAWYVDMLGLVPEGARGRIYRNFEPISLEFFRSLPYPSIYGTDFGYSEDPNAIVEMKIHNNMVFWHEVIYEAGLTNPKLAAEMDVKGVSRKAKNFADNAEGKSIQELRDLGFNVLPADKGPDSILFGIKKLQGMKNYATITSLNLWNELEEYKWMTDKDGEVTDTPIDKFNHLLDAGRYAIVTEKQFLRRRKTTIANDKSDHDDNRSLLDRIS
ncbi:PBSX family phage terminase large subunit [Chitinophaga sp. Hz27]|uniref:PBSX family phage terminase large subunit n=1 Tax=Chitinophaga sp. Hz27 TaxID=3347169 RepID=UPI0035DAEEA5